MDEFTRQMFVYRGMHGYDFLIVVRKCDYRATRRAARRRMKLETKRMLKDGLLSSGDGQG